MMRALRMRAGVNISHVIYFSGPTAFTNSESIDQYLDWPILYFSQDVVDHTHGSMLNCEIDS